MPWYHRVATFLNHSLPQLRATRRTNLALLTVAILERRALAISVLVRAWRVELPYSHHQRKKRLFRFLSNTGFDTVAVQTGLLGPICQTARLKGLVPIMIDWSDLGQGRNGLFAAVCFRGRGLPLLSWVSTPQELNPSQNRVEEFFIRSAVAPPAHQHPTPAAGGPGFRASQPDPFRAADASPYRLPRGLCDPPQGRRGGTKRRLSWPVAGLSSAQGPHQLLAADPVPLRRRRGHQSGPVLGPRSSGTLVPGHLTHRPRRAVRMYRKRMQPEQYFRDGKQRFGLDRSTVTTTHRLQRLLVGLLLACCLLILLGMRASPTFRRQVCSRGKLGILHLGYEFYLANPDPPDNPFPIHHQTGYA